MTTKNSRRVLIVEDDAAIRRGIVDALRYAGYEVLEAHRADVGLELALAEEFDLLLLDLVLPAGDGFEILARLREFRPLASVIILTARGEEADRIRGLVSGADDYVVKPFSVGELLARVEAVLRRTPLRPVNIDTVEIPGGLLDFQRREVRLSDGRRESLSERESELLLYLARNSGRAISRDELLAHVWRLSPRGIHTRTIDMHIARLREKLRDNSDVPVTLLTVRGQGYMFQAEQKHREADTCHE
jgi:DNA-binding response OmpR family regulator